ncbi:MAG: MOSC domain-containing protein [Bacteroidetes bacterium]|nr:MOSC domain-containing protein [Bacteroidota bacterium]
MPVLDEIRIYPVKSLPGLMVDQAEVQPKGLKFDRRMMVVDADGQFITQRTEPLLSQFDLEIKGDLLEIRSRINVGQGIKISLLEDHRPKEAKARVWEDEVEVVGVSGEADDFFSSHLGRGCRLVRFPESAQRDVDPDYAVGHDQVSLADGFPYIMISRESLSDLNRRLSITVSMDRFRPNLVISGVEPYGEDQMKKMVVGSVDFAGVKPCSRCNLITIDPETGVSGKEPLATLSEYRKRGGKVYFGQNLIAENYGFIKRGDVVEKR